jgi:glutamine amidotransferase
VTKHIQILQLNSGNIDSVATAFRKVGAHVQLVTQKSELSNSASIVLPGVGHFQNAVEHLKAVGLFDSIKEFASKDHPILGICLGMHLLASHSEEGDSGGLNLFDARVKELKMENTVRYKIPHNGWNTLHIEKQTPMLKGINENMEFFFLHKYSWQTSNSTDVFATSIYESQFPAVIGKGNCWGVQFHPEKSHDAGLQLLENFIQI